MKKVYASSLIAVALGINLKSVALVPVLAKARSNHYEHDSRREKDSGRLNNQDNFTS